MHRLESNHLIQNFTLKTAAYDEQTNEYWMNKLKSSCSGKFHKIIQI